MGETAPIEPRELLEHAGWVRALARRLVRDEHIADDVTQEVLATAIRHPPRTRTNVRAWLAVSVRNALHSASRSTRRRARRERVASRGERVPATVELVERLDVHRRLVDEIQRLAEPYRTVILLRYFEGRSLAEIARACDVPVPTVTSRLRRALDLLRARLDAAHGSREAWIGLLVPFVAAAGVVGTEAARGSIARIAASAPRRSASSATPSLSHVAGIVAAASVVVVITLFVMHGSKPDVGSAGDRIAASGGARGPSGTNASVEPSRTLRGMSPAPSSSAGDLPDTAAVQAASGSATEVLRGRVVDAEGVPVTGVGIGFVATRVVDRYPNSGLRETSRFLDERTESVHERRDRVLARTSADALGYFELAPPIADGRVIVLDPDLVTVLAGVAYDGLRAERVVVVAPARPVTGYAVDERGIALADAQVSLRLPSDLRSRIGIALDESVTMSWTTRTDADGTFRIDGAPTVAGSYVDVAAMGRDLWTSSIDVADPAPHFVATLEPNVRGADAVRGSVVSPAGEPVAEALVLCEGRRTFTDERGEFSLPAADASTARTLQVLAKGWSAFAIDVRASEPWPDPLRIVLHGEPAMMSGRVVHADGRPASGAWVWLADPTFEEVVDGDPVAVEALLAGADTTRVRWRIVTADGRGRFRMSGLLDRRYRLRASSGNSLAIAEVGPLRSDATDVEIVLPANRDVRPLLEGIVVDRLGAPMPDVSVTTSSVAFEVADRTGRGSGWRWFASGPSTRTDAAGRFRLEGVPREAESLHFRGDGVVPRDLSFERLDAGDAEIPVDGESLAVQRGDSGGLTVVLSRSCHLRVVSHPNADPDLVFELRDANDDLVVMEWKLGIGAKKLRECSLGCGASPALSVPERVCEIVYRVGDTIVGRTPIELVPGEVTTEHYRGT